MFVVFVALLLIVSTYSWQKKKDVIEETVKDDIKVLNCTNFNEGSNVNVVLTE